MNTSFFRTIRNIISKSANELFRSRRERITSKYKTRGLIILALAVVLIAGCTSHRGMNHGSGSRSMSNGHQADGSHAGTINN